MKSAVIHQAIAIGLLSNTLAIAGCGQSVKTVALDSAANVDMRTTGTVSAPPPTDELNARGFPPAPIYPSYGI